MAKIVTLFLIVLDIGVWLLAHWIDARFPLPHQHVNRESFFNNETFDEPVDRFLLSKGGTLLVVVIFLSIMIFTC